MKKLNIDLLDLKDRLTMVASMLNERQRRIYYALEAESLGWGGKTIVHNLTGVALNTLTKGYKELKELRSNYNNLSKEEILNKIKDDTKKIRKKGGGRKKLKDKYPDLIPTLEKLVEDTTYGNPENPLKYKSKSLQKLSEELTSMGFPISATTVGKYLKAEGYSLQKNRKLIQVGEGHPDRDEQFKYGKQKTEEFKKSHQPVISSDVKKKENVGNYSNGGSEYHEKGKCPQTYDHDFCNQKAVPHGVYDENENIAYVTLGCSHDTSEFAVGSIKNWWKEQGSKYYRNAKRILIKVDGGGSNSSRSNLWKYELQKLADEIGIDIYVFHFPPGASKWNPIEHKVFPFISMNWRGKPLLTYELILNYITNTTNKTGLKIYGVIDKKEYQTGIKISKEQVKKINIVRDEFHGEWNYAILSNLKKDMMNEFF